MTTFLMHADRDFHPEVHWRAHQHELFKDLDLPGLVAAMAASDDYLADVAQQALRAPLATPADIEYRQRVLIDVLENPVVVRDLYQLATDTVAAEGTIYRSIFSHSPSAVLRQPIKSLEMLVGMLGRLRLISRQSRGGFHPPGFSRFFGMVEDELDDDYFGELDDPLTRLKFKNGMAIGAGQGRANKGTAYLLSNPGVDTRNWFLRLSGPRQESYSFQIHERDEAGHRALAELEGYGVELAANVLAQSDDHIMAFIKTLRLELAFYVGCLNLGQLFLKVSAPLCFPKPEEAQRIVLSARDLRDVSLTVAGRGPVVGNELNADNKALIMVTGAKEGGKSTFLRSLGTAQLMMQCGMFVCAGYFTSAVASGIYSHYKREEDASLKSGKLDEELDRMSSMVDTMQRHAMVLFNESFSSTDEREGTAIARDIIRALLLKAGRTAKGGGHSWSWRACPTAPATARTCTPWSSPGRVNCRPRQKPRHRGLRPWLVARARTGRPHRSMLPAGSRCQILTTASMSSSLESVAAAAKRSSQAVRMCAGVRGVANETVT